MKKRKKSKSKSYPFLSLCMIVKDEEKWLAQCLSSVASIVQEIIIVDTGSMDNTVEIVKSFGAKVFHHAWNNDFAEARNVSLEHATGEWVFVLDADEIIAKKDLPGIWEACLSGRFNAYTLITRNYTADSRGSNWVPNDEAYKEAKGLPGWFPSRKVRLFKNNKDVRFEGAVHELAEPSIKKLGWHIGLCDIPVHHFGRLEPGKQKEKEGTYLKLGHKKIVAGAQNPKAYYERGVQNAELGLHAKAIEDFYVARKIAPSFPGIDSYLGASLTHLEKCDEAIAILDEGAKKEPENAGLWNNLGLAYYAKQDYGKAVKYLNKAVCLNPEYAAAYKNLGMALSKKGKAAEAADAFQTALGLNPSLVEIKGALEALEKMANAGEKQDKRAGPRVMVLETESGVIGEDCVEALNGLGCTTTRETVKDKPYGSDHSSFDMPEMLCRIIDFKPDFMLSINHKGLDPEGLISYACQELNIPVFIWYVDNPFSVTDWDHYDPPRNIIFLIFDSVLVARLNETMEDFVYHLPLGTNPNRFKPVPLSHEDQDRYECDISFVGNLDLNKADMLRNMLKKNWNNIPPVMWDIMDSIICMAAKE
ncbi:MAG: glycosyltransferase, partial [Spirochaetales bacterium]|nr:glycosyltransferase [Spirochaetales bacterium]